MRALAKRLLSDQSGAIAAVYALALPMLIMAGGVAFDYARLAAMDTELQNAADQAALAAASQLDGSGTAITRATSAAQGMVVNKTLFANDGNASGTTVTVLALVFYDFYDAANDTGTTTSDPTKAKYVKVTVDDRVAKYALTPIMGAISSGKINASAVAGLGGSICKVPPLMMCNPGTAAYPSTADIGKGLLLQYGGGDAYTPGNYGYLDFGPGASELKEALGANDDIANCIVADTLKTEPGNKASVPESLNVRFDMFQNGLTNVCAPGTGKCSPAMNTRKDVLHLEEVITSTKKNKTSDHPVSSCTWANGGSDWILPPVQYAPNSAGISVTPTNMGLPRDICHAKALNGTCVNKRFGDGNWDEALYFAVNHAGLDGGATNLSLATSAAGKTLSNTLTRYDVYRWELSKPALSSRIAQHAYTSETQGQSVVEKTTNYCSYSQPQIATGVAATSTQRDRRILTAAVVDCASGEVRGSTNIRVQSWIDLFLVEPSLDRERTKKDEIYVEIIGVGQKPGGGSALQYFSRNRPYLIK